MTEYPANYLKPQSSPLEYYAPPAYGSYPSAVSHTNSARWAYQRLVNCIRNFEAKFDDEHEIGVRLLSSGSPVNFHLRDINYCDPIMLTFHVKNDQGEELQLIQHVSQLSVLLVPIEKLGKNPVRIGNKLRKALGEERTS